MEGISGQFFAVEFGSKTFFRFESSYVDISLFFYWKYFFRIEDSSGLFEWMESKGDFLGRILLKNIFQIRKLLLGHFPFFSIEKRCLGCLLSRASFWSHFQRSSSIRLNSLTDIPYEDGLWSDFCFKKILRIIISKKLLEVFFGQKLYCRSFSK